MRFTTKGEHATVGEEFHFNRRTYTVYMYMLMQWINVTLMDHDTAYGEWQSN